MTTFKNIQFTLLIRIGKQLHEFNFRKRSPELFDADTADERGNRHYFKMIKTDDEWTLKGTGLPDWIIKNDATITDAFTCKISATANKH